jgi:hypothetical protein
MRYYILIVAVALLSSFFTWVVMDRVATAKAHSAAVVTDEESGVVRIVIDGKDIMRIDADSVEINGILKPARIVHPTLSGPLPSGNGGSE